MKAFVLSFLHINYKVITGFILGFVLGYLYWNSFGIGWGTYPLSSEWWVNCIYGGLAGGLIVSLFPKNKNRAMSPG